MVEARLIIEQPPSHISTPELSTVEMHNDYSPFPDMYTDFFEEPGASVIVVTRTGKQIHVESTDELRYPAYCQGSVGIGKGTCEGPTIEPGENHIETTVVDPIKDDEKGRYFYHVQCYVQHKLGYAADVVDPNPSKDKKEEVIQRTRRISKTAMVELFGPAPKNLARHGNR